jgi:hypothetical protein
VFASPRGDQALQEEKRPHGASPILIECCEESGSGDLPAYFRASFETNPSTRSW